jgi:hypothetical protein
VEKSFETNVISELILVKRSPKVQETEAFRTISVVHDRYVMSGAWTTVLIRNTTAALFTAGVR